MLPYFSIDIIFVLYNSYYIYKIDDLKISVWPLNREWGSSIQNKYCSNRIPHGEFIWYMFGNVNLSPSRGGPGGNPSQPLAHVEPARGPARHVHCLAAVYWGVMAWGADPKPLISRPDLRDTEPAGQVLKLTKSAHASAQYLKGAHKDRVCVRL